MQGSKTTTNYSYITNKEEKYLLMSMLDKMKKEKKTGQASHSNFLNQKQAKLITALCEKEKYPFTVKRFTDDCEKVIITFGTIKEPVICCFKVIADQPIRHQDILGSLFGLGLKEDVIGDIFVEEEASYFLILSSLKDMVKKSLLTIGKAKVELEEISSFQLKEEHFIDRKIMVKSLRMDAILSKLLNLSRKQSTLLFELKKVLVNYEQVTNDHLIGKVNDIISIRGYGKYKIASIVPSEKKDRIEMIVKQYK